MKKLILFLTIIVFFLSTAGFAQMRKDPEERANELKEKLNLTDEQTEQVKQIYFNADNEIKSKVQGSGNREQMREAMKTIMSNTDNEILKIINDEQKEKYNEIIQEREERMPGPQRNFN